MQQSVNDDPLPPLLKIENFIDINPNSSIDQLNKLCNISCVEADSKLIVIGTSDGFVYIYDFMGNCIHHFNFKRKNISALSIDSSSEFIAVAMEESAMIIICSSCTKSIVKSIQLPYPATFVQISSRYHSKSVTDRFVIVGMKEKMGIIEETWVGNKFSDLHHSESNILAVTISSTFLAWCDDSELSVMHLKKREITGNLLAPDNNKDHSCLEFQASQIYLSWMTDDSLLVAQRFSIQVLHIICQIPNHQSVSPNHSTSSISHTLNSTPSSSIKLELVRLYQLSDPIFGCYSNNGSILYISLPRPSTIADICEKMNQKNEDISESTAPKLNDLASVKLTILSPRGNSLSSADSSSLFYPLDMDFFSKNTDKSLTLLYYSENNLLAKCKDETTFFLILPNNFLMIQPRSEEDQIDWLIRNSQYEEAVNFAKFKPEKFSQPSLKIIRKKCLDDVISKNHIVRPSVDIRMIANLIDKDPLLWNELAKYCLEQKCIEKIWEYISPENSESHPMLNQSVFTEVMIYLMETNEEKFVNSLKITPSRFYDGERLLDELEKITTYSLPEEHQTLYHAKAILYSRKKLFQKGIDLYIQLKHSEVFNLIEKHQLFEEATHNISILMEIDKQVAIRLFVENVKTIRPDVVIAEISTNQSLLIEYLIELNNKAPKYCKEYQNLMLEMMIRSKHPNLSKFLKEASFYDINKAIELCKKYEMYNQLAILYERSGDLQTTLKIIVSNLKDISSAIELCRKYNRSEMWDILIDNCLLHPMLLKSLFKHSGTLIDPLKLLKRIPPDICIPDLKTSLVQIMKDCSAHLDLHDSSLRVMTIDGIDQLMRLQQSFSQACVFTDEVNCKMCDEVLFYPTASNPNVGPNYNKICVFRCGHAFHLRCYRPTPKEIFCQICHGNEFPR